MANDGTPKNWLLDDVTRRTFLGSAVVVGSTAVAGVSLSRRARADVLDELHYDCEPDPVTDATYVYTTCLMCHSDCGMKVRVVDGVAVKIEGNPFHPQNLEADERLPYASDPDTNVTTNGRLCAKGQAAIETLYNPLRIKAPLRRVGARGEGEWETVTWDEALDDFAAQLALYYSQTAMTNDYGDNLGPEANRVVYSKGRQEYGPEDFVKRWFNKGYGTINAPCGHTTICEASRHVASSLVAGGNKHLKPDIENTTFLMLWGTSPLDAGFPMQSYARKLMRAINDNGCTVVVIDPRFSNTAAKGRWVPLKPGTDAALALGMCRHILENDLYDATFLSNPNSTAASADGESCYSDATLLVRADTGKFLTRANIDGGSTSDYVVWTGGTTAWSASATEGDLFVDQQTVTLSDGSSVVVSSVFQLLWNRCMERSLQAYAEICEVSADTIREIAEGFAAAGKTAAIDHYRGPSGHTNGTYNAATIMALCSLVGCYDHKGGMSKGGGHWEELTGDGTGTAASTVYGGVSTSGIPLWRSGSSADYFSTNEYATEGVPARRQWFPIASEGNFQELLPSMAEGYPYKIGVYITYCNNTVYTTPASRLTAARVLGDESAVPYFVAIDIDMSETTVFADLVLPDTMFLEQWGCPHLPPLTLVKASPWRQPVVGTINKTDPTQDGYEPYLPELRDMADWMIDLGKRLGIPGVGDDAFAVGDPLHNSWQWYGRLLDNLVADYVADGYSLTAEEVEARGGIFQDAGSEYSGDLLSSKIGKRVNLYLESLATKRDSQTGEYYEPLPVYEPPMDSQGNHVETLDGGSYPFQLITYKPAFHTQSRTALDPSLMMLMPENFLEMNSGDGRLLGLENGDTVRIQGPSGGIISGKVKLTQGMKPGVVAIANSYGHWELGSRPYKIDGETQAYDATRGAGLHCNTLMRLDPNLGDVCLQDKVGGSASFYDTRVRVEKA